MNRPNVLWICSDQQRFDTLGCSGNPFVRTPNIDRLAQDGVLFERAYCQNPLCTPSRASFLTGRYPRTTRCRQNGQSIPSDEVLVTKLLRDAGYFCGLSGKLHLSACHPSICKGVERRIDDGYDEFHWSHHPADDWPANEYSRWLEQQGAAYESVPFEGSPYVRTSVPPELHQTTWCAERAIHFVEERARSEEPWLFSVNIFDPHHAFDPPREYLERYLDSIDEIPLPNYVEGELENKTIWQRRYYERMRQGSGGLRFCEMADRDHRLARAAYYAMCDLIDEQVGRMLDALERTGQIENTIVIFMSDHGEMLGDHGIYLKGPYFYEPAVHIPLIISSPGRIAPERTSGALVELVDLAPTLLDACGLERHPGMQGRSLWAMLTGQAPLDHHRDDVYCEFYGSHALGDSKPHLTMVRTERYKIVVDHGQDVGELYDLRNDPSETDNLWTVPQASAVRCEMMECVADRIAWTTDPLPEREGPW